MRLTWRERLAQQPRLWQWENWPVIDLDTVPVNNQKTYLRNQHILAQVLAGQPLKTVAQSNQISDGRLTQLLNRCLGGDDADPPVLTKGLIPFVVVETKQRKIPLPTLVKPRGTACAFQQLLLAAPDLQEAMNKTIVAKLKDSDYAQSITPQGLHGTFKQHLIDVHWPKTDYPYTTASMAYDSVRRYLHSRVAELRLSRQQKRTRAPRPLPKAKHYRALQTTQTDEHLLDMRNNVHLELNDELIPLSLARASVLVTNNVETNCILGFHVAYAKQPNQQDMLTLFDNCLSPWQPMTLTTPGLSYSRGACFPSGLPDAFPITFGTMQLDNALMHRAHSIVDFICDKQGGTLSYGHPRSPTIRELIESVFDYINKHGTHRFASTTGSHPTDPKKESRKNQKRVPTVSLRTLIEALSILLTEYNITPQNALGGATPLDLFRYHCRTHFIRYVPHTRREQWRPMLGEQIVHLHWYQDERRAPFVNFMYQRYQGSGLWQALPKNKKIRIQFNRNDLRHVQAFTMDGENLGQLNAPLSWQRFAHSLATRQKIHRLTKTHRLNARDPLAAYFNYLLENKGQSKIALQLIQVYHEYTDDKASLIFAKPHEPIAPLSLTSTSDKATWHTSQAMHQS